jgi:hypothetical protein
LEVEKQTFRNELGVPSIPVYSSLKKFITDFSKDKTNPFFHWIAFGRNTAHGIMKDTLL